MNSLETCNQMKLNQMQLEYGCEMYVVQNGTIVWNREKVCKLSMVKLTRIYVVNSFTRMLVDGWVQGSLRWFDTAKDSFGNQDIFTFWIYSWAICWMYWNNLVSNVLFRTIRAYSIMRIKYSEEKNKNKKCVRHL